MIVSIVLVCAASSVTAQDAATEIATDAGGGEPIAVSKLEVRYVGPSAEEEGLPTLRELLYDEVELVERGGVLDAPGMGSVVRRFKLFELVLRGRANLTSAALDSVLASVESSLTGRGYDAFEVRPEPRQFERVDGVWRDRRLIGERLTIEIVRVRDPLGVGQVSVPGVGANVVPPPSPARPGPPPPELRPLASDGVHFEITGFSLTFLREHPQHPAVDDLLATPVALTPTPDGFVAPRGYGPIVVLPIADIASEAPAVVYASAVSAVTRTIVERLREEGLAGVYVRPSPDAIEETPGQLVDRRPGGTGPFPIEVYTAIVTRIGSSATGDRVPLEGRIDHPYHRRIRERSPVRPYDPSPRPEPLMAAHERTLAELAEGEPEPSPPSAEAIAAREEEIAAWEARSGERRDLLRSDLLNEYAQRLNRHPGRQVDVAVAPGEEYGEAELQFIVREEKPWTVFTQLSNTGTESTSEFRQRFGFVHTQFTNADDILSLDFTTAEFDSSNAVTAFYDRPILGNERLRWNIQGGYNEFTAADVGSGGESFEGESWFVSAEIVGTIFQHDELFIDAFAGARYQDITVEDLSVFSTGPAQEAIFLPRVGVRASRLGAWSSFSASAQLEWTINELTGADEDGLEELGRIGPEEEWAVFSGGISASVFLEPLFNYEGWSDPTTPGSSTLAHELSFRLSGQYSFNKRLIPNAEGVIGGLFTVRGYPESLVAGDSTYSGSVEYRFHVPRVFAIDPTPSSLFGRPFRVSPQQVYGSPDWDLVLKGFFDFGETFIAQPLGFETAETLASVGVGLEVRLYSNLSFRTDWGFVLNEVASGSSGVVEQGDERVHLLFTLAY